MEPVNAISIIVCCYNSALRLPKTLHYLRNQSGMENFFWEIIIVDNNSTDETDKIAKAVLSEFCSIPGFSYTIIFEREPGLSQARKAGVKSAKYEALLFCDDDNWLDRHYLSSCIQLLNTHRDLSILGSGNSIAVSDIPMPSWFLDFGSILACRQLKELQIGRNITDDVYAFGAGMAVRKKLYINYLDLCSKEPIRLKLDRQKYVLLSGGDTDLNLFAFAQRTGVGLFPQLRLEHYMPPSRVSKDYLINLRKYTTASSLILQKINFGEFTNVKWHILGLIKYLLLQLFKGPFYFRMALAGLSGANIARKIFAEMEAN
jgi:glycosyltransferase involved in cell wall biosynthesis